MNNWYNKFDLIKRIGHLSCPNCDMKFDEQILYSFDKTKCKKCSCDLIFHRDLEFIYIIHFQSSPSPFKNAYENLKNKTLKEVSDSWHYVKSIFD
jgi:hypothetical protein